MINCVVPEFTICTSLQEADWDMRKKEWIDTKNGGDPLDCLQVGMFFDGEEDFSIYEDNGIFALSDNRNRVGSWYIPMIGIVHNKKEAMRAVRMAFEKIDKIRRQNGATEDSYDLFMIEALRLDAKKATEKGVLYMSHKYVFEAPRCFSFVDVKSEGVCELIVH